MTKEKKDSSSIKIVNFLVASFFGRLTSNQLDNLKKSKGDKIKLKSLIVGILSGIFSSILRNNLTIDKHDETKYMLFESALAGIFQRV